MGDRSGLIIASGINNLLLALFLSKNLNVHLIYVNVYKKKRSPTEAIVIEKIQRVFPNINKIDVFCAPISESYSSKGNKKYSIDFPTVKILFDQYNKIIVTSNLLPFVQKNLKSKVVIDCIAEGGSVVINAKSKNNIIVFAVNRLKKLLKIIEKKIGRPSINFEVMYLPPSHENRLHRFFLEQNYCVGSVDFFKTINLTEYQKWSRALLCRADLSCSINKDGKHTWFHLSNKRIPIHRYRNWILSGRDETRLIIKMHPTDDRDLRRIFPLATVIDDEQSRLIPAELWDFDDLDYYGWFSTFLYMHDPKRINLVKVPEHNYYEYSLKRFKKLMQISGLNID